MAKIIIEINSHFQVRKEIRQLDGPEVRIGRGYGCDLIIQDPFVSDCHVILRILDGNLIVEDQRSRNGVFIVKKGSRRKGKRSRITSPTEVASGDALIIGQTHLRIFSAHHPVSPARRAESQSTFLRSINNPINLWYAVIGFFLLYYIRSLFQFEEVKISNGQIIFWEFILFLGMIIWAGLWSFIGRLIRHRARFVLHLTLTCFFAIVIIPLVNVAEYVGFLFASVGVAGLLWLAGVGTAFTLLLMGHQAAATFLSLRARIFFSAMIPVIVLILGAVGFFAFESDFRQKPNHFIMLKPPIVRPILVSDEERFLEKMSKVFEDAEKQIR